MTSTDSTTDALEWTEIVSSAEDATTVSKAFYYMGKAVSALVSAGDDLIAFFG